MAFSVSLVSACGSNPYDTAISISCEIFYEKKENFALYLFTFHFIYKFMQFPLVSFLCEC